MIKSELVQRMAARNPHLYQRDIENIIDAILGEIADALARGERVELRGFGAFSTKQRRARTGRNPHLYQRDIENIIDAILGEIVDALAQGERVEPVSYTHLTLPTIYSV